MNPNWKKHIKGYQVAACYKVFRPKVLIVVDRGKGLFLKAPIFFVLSSTWVLNFNTAAYIALIAYWLCNIIYFIPRKRKGCFIS